MPSSPIDPCGCPGQTGEEVIMCLNGRDVLVPRCEVEALKEEGAICGSCLEICCPDEPGDKIDMCLNGRTINVSRNACKGIKQAGGTCGPCESEVIEE